VYVVNPAACRRRPDGRCTWRAVLLACALSASGPLSAAAQDWPIKPIRVISPLAPGGAVDLIVRTIGDQLTANLGQPTVLENRPGGVGTIAAEIVACAQPDGYTLLASTPAIQGIAPYLVKKTSFDARNDFTAIANAIELPIVLVVHQSVPANNVAEFIVYAKNNPGQLSFGSSGYGTSHHLAGEYLNAVAGIKMVHVPYRGGAPAMTDLLAGQIPVAFATLSTVMPYIGTGKIKVLGAVEDRSPAGHPDIPPIDATVPGFVLPPSWTGFVAPAGIAPGLADRMHDEFEKAKTAPKVRNLLEQNAFEVVFSSRKAFADEIMLTLDRYKKIIDTTGVAAE
jgi:tripartite-type tricarboxylate transporter receptor subunit TctC